MRRFIHIVLNSLRKLRNRMRYPDGSFNNAGVFFNYEQLARNQKKTEKDLRADLHLPPNTLYANCTPQVAQTSK